MSCKIAILFQTHLISNDILKEFEKIVKESDGIADTYLYFDDKCRKIPDEIKKYKFKTYNNEEISSLNYPIIKKIETNDEITNKRAYRHVNYQLSILKFFLDNPGYDYYWYIEYDVRYTGNWGSIFKNFNNESDLTASYVRTYQQRPDWPFWYLSHPTSTIHETKRISSFHPVMRISNRALTYLHNSLKDGWIGYLEMLVPTLLHEHGFKLEDFGGSGDFCNNKNINKNYLGSPENKNGTLDFGTMRYRPHIIYFGLKKNMLYHPVKPVKNRITYYFIRFTRFLKNRIRSIS